MAPVENPRPLEALRNHALNGSLKFEGKGAQKLAGEARRVRETINTVLGKSEFNYLKTMTDLTNGPQKSGEQLAQKFKDLAGHAETVLKNHKTTLNDMIDIFHASTGNYGSAEEWSKKGFNKLDTFKVDARHAGRLKSRGITPRHLLNNQIGTPSHLQGRRELEYAGKIKYKVDPSVKAENPQSWSFDQHQTFARSIVPVIASISRDAWLWMNEALTTSFGDLDSNLIVVKDPDLWSGTGRDQIATAAQSYQKNTTELLNTMNLISVNLDSAYGWLEDTKTMLYSASASDPDIEGGRQFTVNHMLPADPADRAKIESILLPQLNLPIDLFYNPQVDYSAGTLPAVPEADNPTSGTPEYTNPTDDGTTDNKDTDPKGNDPKDDDPKGDDPKGNDPKGNDPQGNDPSGNDPGSTDNGVVGDQGGATTADPTLGQTNTTGMSSTTTGVDNVTTASQTLAPVPTATAGMAGIAGARAVTGSPTSNAPKATAAAARPVSSGPKVSGVGARPGGTGPGAQRLFPRAGGAPGAGGIGRGGPLAAGNSQGGMPGGRRQKGEEDGEYDRADYLDSDQHIDEAVGALPDAYKPVVE